MITSLQSGLAACAMAEHVLFTPVDLPQVKRATVERLATVRHGELVMPCYKGHCGHPVRVSRAIANELIAAPAHAQAREVLKSHRSQTHLLAVNDPGIRRDVDTPEQYAALLRSGAAK